MTVDGIVFKIKKYALHDGPGIRTTVFLKGCPLRCWWCHNPEGQVPEPEPMPLAMAAKDRCDDRSAIVGRRWTVKALLAEIEKDRLFYDESGGGATFSGGEPLAQPEFLKALLEQCRLREIHTAVDTSGYAPEKLVEAVLAKADLVLYDLKTMDDAAHRRYTGVDNRLILDNLKTLAGLGPEIVVRIPLVPGINDDPDNIRTTAQFVRSLNTVRQVDLLPFHAIADGKYRRLELENKMNGVRSPTREACETLGHIFTQAGLTVTYGG
jgi:pyruvate formate lyase activating enzyme